jgi:hypothetical protein
VLLCTLCRLSRQLSAGGVILCTCLTLVHRCTNGSDQTNVSVVLCRLAAACQAG